MTCLQFAAHNGHFDLIPLLISHDADPNAAASEFGCALQCAISSVQHNGTPDKLWWNRTDYGTEELAAKQDAQLDAVLELLEAGAAVNPGVVGGELGTPLGAAAVFGIEDIVEKLLSLGANVDSSAGRMGTALIAAVARGGMPIEWAVSHASEESYIRVVQRLLQSGAKVNAIGGIYGTALQAAASVGDLPAVEMLLQHNADPNLRAEKYTSPLSAAAFMGHLQIVERLIEGGAEFPPLEFNEAREEDDWDTWREEPIGGMVLQYGAALPSAKVAPSANGRQGRIDDPVGYDR